MSACGYERDDGSACRSTVGLCPDCGHCANHCEHRRDVMQKARSKGGHVIARKKEAEHMARTGAKYLPAEEGQAPPPPENAADAKAYLAWLLDAGTRGVIGSTLARDMAQVAEKFLKAVGVADHEARIGKLEEAAKARRKDGRP